jgi:hypothetical protein
MPGNDRDVYLHLTGAALWIDDCDPLSHVKFTDYFGFRVVLQGDNPMFDVRRHDDQLPGAALQSLLAHRDADPATPYPPDLITSVVVQTDTRRGRSQPDHPDAGSAVTLIKQDVKGCGAAGAVSFDND